MQGRERGKEDDDARKQWESAAPRLALRADPCAAGCRDRRGRDRQQQQHAGRQAGRLPGPVNRREMLIIRKFDGRKSSRKGPDQAGTGAGAGDTFRTGAGDPGPNTPPAPLPTHLFNFLVLLTSSPTPVPFFSLVPGFLHLRSIFPGHTFFDRYFGLRPAHFIF